MLVFQKKQSGKADALDHLRPEKIDHLIPKLIP